MSKSIRTIRVTTLSLALAAAFSPLSSQAATDDTIVVVATRQPSRVNNLAADVTVLDRSQIEQAGPGATLGDLLVRSIGAEMSRAGGRGATEGIFLRGANSGHTLVLIDGMRIGSATLGETAIDAIPLNQVERVEILRGPASALYGGDAIGGVISIFTRQGANAPRFEFNLGAGSRGAQEIGLAHAGRIGEIDYALRLGETRASGVNAITNLSSPAYNSDMDGFWRRNLGLHATWRVTQGTEIGVSYLESDGKNHFDTSWPTAAADWQTRQKMTNYGVHAKRRWTPGWSSEFRLDRSEDKSVTTPSQNFGQAADVFRTQRDQFVWQNDIHLPLGQGLVALESLRERVASSNVFSRTGRDTDSLVLGWSGSQEAHFWQAGMRRDQNSQFGGKTTGNLAYGYRLTEQWRVSGSAGTSFKAPTFNDLYFPNTPWVGAGNPNLQPESGKSRELALRYAQGGTEASLTAFHNDIRNLIQWTESPPGSWFYVPNNVGQARIAGWAATWRTHFDAWLIDANVNSQNPKDVSTGEFLVRRAKTFGSVGATYEAAKWLAGVEAQGAGTRYDAPDFVTHLNTRKMGGYGVMNVHGEYRFENGWALVGRIDNLFDRQYELVHSSSTIFNTLGRTLFLGARFKLK